MQRLRLPWRGGLSTLRPMCLAVPGKVLRFYEDAVPMADVAFGQVVKPVCVAYVPEAQVGDYVIVHVGFAIGRLNAEEAQRTLRLLTELGDLGALGEFDSLASE